MEEIDETKQKNRSRKKQLYASIRNQMEFYFSPSNLHRDGMTSRLLNDNGCIELTQFLMYNKIRALTNNVKDLAKALKHSTQLEVTEDMKVKPIIMKTKDNIDECTIYVEQIPQDAEHDWLKEQFSVYGTVDYVSIPKFSSSKKCKGFAFVEFSCPEYAEKAVEEYKKSGCYLPTSEMDPKELLSIVHNSINEQSKKDLLKGDKNKKKRKIESDTAEEPLNKKIKNDNEKEAEIANNPAEQLSSENKLQKETEITENLEPTEEKMQESNDENTEDTKKKKNRNKKKKAKKTKITPETSGFKILSKKDWKRLRNKYLNVQRDKMKLLKQHLYQVKKKQMIDEKVDEESKNILELVPGTVVKISVDDPIINTKEFKKEITEINKNVKHVDLREGCTCVHARFITDQEAKQFCQDSPWPKIEILTGKEEIEYWKQIQKDREVKQNKPKVKQKNEKNDESNSVLSTLKPGMIVKINVDNPIINTRQFKDEITKINNDVKYVDLREGWTCAYARFKTDEAAKKFCEDSPWPQIEVLTGSEEVEYWKRIQNDREEKLNKPKGKQRGKEKLFKKAEKALGRHIIFDDAEL